MTQKKGKQDKKKIRYPPHTHTHTYMHIRAQWHGIRPDETLSLAPTWTEQDNVFSEMNQAQKNKY